jgi:hypothetical protein
MREVPRFARRFFDPAQRLFRIGEGALGGKARGLLDAEEVLREHGDRLAVPGFTLDVPSLVVLAGDFFETFVERNDLGALLAEQASDRRIAEAFHAAPVPAEMVGDLRALAQEIRVPLAVRSSSVLEDALGQPFAGVYGTKMIPCNQPDADARFRSLLDAVKFVWASTFFARARAYLAGTSHRGERETMAVLVQEVVGGRHGERVYPEISGVARSHNFYPSGGAAPEEGVLALALGLGKTIVDGGACWSLSPARPRALPPFASAHQLVEATQSSFWAVHVGAPPPYDPMAETEYLVAAGLEEAEADGALRFTASTYDPASDRIWPGLGRRGPRVLDFAPVLVHEELALVPMVRAVLAACAEQAGGPVEIEFAVALGHQAPARFGLLQVRPQFVSSAVIELEPPALDDPKALVVSESTLGNGERRLEDVVYVVPERFDAAATADIALELEGINRELLAAGRECLLIGFGRWGSADPWLGIPVRWDQISSARVIVEASLPAMNPEPSQGSHFFHNLSSFDVLYLTVPAGGRRGVAWQALAALPVVAESAHVRHVRSPRPLRAAVDGRRRLGLVAPLESP